MSVRMGRRRRPQILPVPVCYYGSGRYPEKLRASFMDGKTKVYDEHVRQPEPTFFSTNDIRRMSNTPGSYKYTRRRLTVWERLLNRITDFLFPILRK